MLQCVSAPRARRRSAPAWAATGDHHAHDPERWPRRRIQRRRRRRSSPSPQDEGQEEGQAGRPPGRRGRSRNWPKSSTQLASDVRGRASAVIDPGLDVPDQEHDAAAHHVAVDRRHRVVRPRRRRWAERGRAAWPTAWPGPGGPMPAWHLLPGRVQDDQMPPSSGWTGWSKLMVTVCGSVGQVLPLGRGRRR